MSGVFQPRRRASRTLLQRRALEIAHDAQVSQYDIETIDRLLQHRAAQDASPLRIKWDPEEIEHVGRLVREQDPDAARRLLQVWKGTADRITRVTFFDYDGPRAADPIRSYVPSWGPIARRLGDSAGGDRLRTELEDDLIERRYRGVCCHPRRMLVRAALPLLWGRLIAKLPLPRRV